MPKNFRLPKNKLILAGGCAALVLTAAVFLYAQQSRNDDAPDITAETPLGGVNEEAEPSPSTPPKADSPNDTPSSAVPPKPVPPPKPELIKSSGNAGPVHAGAKINFICSTVSGATCNVILEKNGKTIELGKKTATHDGRGGYFTSSNWTAATGSWLVYAKAEKSGASSESANQQLVVE